MTLYLLRHGQTNYNVLDLCNDVPTPDVALTALGRAQAAAAAERLKDTKLERLVTSELPRTRETAGIVNRHHRLPITADPRLNDWRSGLNGRPAAELYAAIAADPLHTRVNDGETLAEHRERVLPFFEELRRATLRCAVLVVAHEETLRAASAWFHGLSDNAMLALKFANGELLRFEW